MLYEPPSQLPDNTMAGSGRDGLRNVIHRFPLVWFCLLGLLVIGEYLSSFEQMPSLRRFVLEASFAKRLFGTLALGVLWGTATHLWAEAAGWPRKKLLGVFSAGLAGIFVFAFQPHAPAMWEWMFLAMGLGILPFIAPFSNQRQEETLLFSRHVANSGMGIVLGGSFYLLIVLLIFLFSSALNGLLEIEIPSDWLERLTLYVGIFFPTLYALSFIPRIPPAETLQVSRAMSFMVTYIAVPALCVFGGLVIVYGLKIVLLWQLPQGNLGIITGNIGAFALGSWIAAQCCPKIDRGLLAHYKRFFPYVWLPINILLIVSIGNRIVAYGCKFFGSKFFGFFGSKFFGYLGSYLFLEVFG
jgi:hypothetical protein